MTKVQFDKAVTIARSDVSLENVDDSILDGCALPGFLPVTIVLEAAAKCIRYHCICFNGQIDSEALENMRWVSRKRWLVC